MLGVVQATCCRVAVTVCNELPVRVVDERGCEKEKLTEKMFIVVPKGFVPVVLFQLTPFFISIP